MAIEINSWEDLQASLEDVRSYLDDKYNENDVAEARKIVNMIIEWLSEQELPEAE